MTELEAEVIQSSERAIVLAKKRGTPLDYSEHSLNLVEEILAEACAYEAEITDEQRDTLVEDLGCYILEVARRNHGGIYRWMPPGRPVLVFGEPSCHIAITTWEKVRGRLSGDLADNIPFFYEGFAERVRKAEPGTNVMLV